MAAIAVGNAASDAHEMSRAHSHGTYGGHESAKPAIPRKWHLRALGDFAGQFFKFLANVISPITVAGFTGLIYYITVAQWQVLEKQLEEMKNTTNLATKTFVSNQRAWIAPISVEIAAEYIVDREMTFIIKYQNIGREPATGTKWDAALRSVRGNPKNPPLNLGEENIGHCWSAEGSETATTTYPSEGTEYRLYHSRLMDKPIGPVLSGEEIPYILGCIKYDSFGERRQSKFCFYWIREEGKNWKDWPWRFCPRGNDAT